MIFHGARKQSAIANVSINMEQLGFAIIASQDATTAGKSFFYLDCHNNDNTWVGITSRTGLSPEQQSRLCVYGIYLVQEAVAGQKGLVEARWAKDTEADFDEGVIPFYPRPHDLTKDYIDNSGTKQADAGTFYVGSPQNSSGAVALTERDMLLGRFDKFRFWAPAGTSVTDYWKLLIGPK